MGVPTRLPEMRQLGRERSFETDRGRRSLRLMLGRSGLLVASLRNTTFLRNTALELANARRIGAKVVGTRQPPANELRRDAPQGAQAAVSAGSAPALLRPGRRARGGVSRSGRVPRADGGSSPRRTRWQAATSSLCDAVLRSWLKSRIPRPRRNGVSAIERDSGRRCSLNAAGRPDPGSAKKAPLIVNRE
jgi:hypothetical protein